MACTWFKKEENNVQVRTRRKKRIGATQSLYPVRVQILQQCHKDIVLLVVQGNFMLCAFSHGSLQHSFQWVTFATKERKRKKRSTLKKNSTHSSKSLTSAHQDTTVRVNGPSFHHKRHVGPCGVVQQLAQVGRQTVGFTIVAVPIGMKHRTSTTPTHATH